MTSAIYHGIVRGGVVMLDDGNSLADGTEVQVTPVLGTEDNGPAIIAALDAAPSVPREWVEELQRLIDDGQRPPMQENVFPGIEDAEEIA
jgi:hypothetical protein